MMPEITDFVDCDCLVCGGGETVASDAITWRDQTLRYVLCRGCGLKFMRPRPTQQWYLRFYEEEFWAEKVLYDGFSAKSTKQKLDYDTGLQKQVQKQYWRADRIRRWIEPHRSLDASTCVLDIGAAFGVTLKVLRDAYGCDVMAVEPSQLAREYGRANFSLKYVGRSMEDLYQPQSFDGKASVVLFSHVLENILDPRAALTAANRLLRPDGLVYIDTCNFFYNNAVNPYHPYIFNAETLTDLLAQTGFQVVARHCDPPPPECEAPGDPYLVLIAKPGKSDYMRRPVDVERLVALQEIGLARIKLVRKANRDVYHGDAA